MDRFSRVVKGLVGVMLLVVAGPVLAAWQLEPRESRLNATIIELTDQGPVPHQHGLSNLGGSLSSDGTLSLQLRLNQTDVLERLEPLPPWLALMRELPLATVVTQLPPERLDSLPVGESMTETLLFGIQSENVDEQQPVALRFSRESADRIRVTNAEPIALDSRELMTNSIARAVLDLLGYQRIDDEVPVKLNAVLIER